MIGFIFLHRDMLNWEWYQHSEASRLFIHLLLKANFTDKNWQGNRVKRGQLITSANHLASELNLSIQKIRTALKKLESSGYITRHPTNKFTLITIVNYDLRQSPSSNANKQSHTPTTNKQHSINIQSTTTKEGNKKNKSNKETLEIRKENFKNLVFEHAKYSDKVLNAFFNYWSEIDMATKKLKFEKQSAFEVKVRLKSWAEKEKNWKTNPPKKTKSISINR